MLYKTLKPTIQKLPLIYSRDLLRLEKSRQALLNQLFRWQAEGLIIKLKKGIYQLNDADRKLNPGIEFIANQLYGPSYVSLEFALQAYGLIPEAVFELTSVTTKKTMRIRNKRGNFTYQHIKPQAFRGFKQRKGPSGFTHFIAEPEKAVVDFLYLNLRKIPVSDTAVFEESFRFQNTKSLKNSRLLAWARLFKNKKLSKVVRNFTRFAKGGGKR